MKRMSLLLGIVAFAAISAPLAAQGKGNGGKYGRAADGVYDRNGDGRIDSRDQVNNGCSWWEVNCTNTRTNGRIDTNRGRNDGRNDSGWYRIGADRAGNAIYERDTYERNGKETIEIARQDRNGHLKVIDKQKVDNRQRNNRIYDPRDDRRGR
ncbi:MAG: hypothetical protein ABR582_13820 [Gemmatimonadaceae bacterium]